MTLFLRPWCFPLFVNSFIPLEHLDEPLNLSGSGLRLLHRLNAKQHSIAVRPIERVEKLQRPRTRIERLLKICRDLRAFGRVVDCIPPTVFLGRFNGLLPSSLHLRARDDRDSLLAVDLRPDARARAWHKTLEPRL